jgi:hypothetical protein
MISATHEATCHHRHGRRQASGGGGGVCGVCGGKTCCSPAAGLQKAQGVTRPKVVTRRGCAEWGEAHPLADGIHDEQRLDNAAVVARRNKVIRKAHLVG